MTRRGEKHVIWTAESDAVLRQMSLEGATAGAIAAALGRSYSSVRCRRGILGISRKLPPRPEPLRRWTAADDARIIADHQAGVMNKVTAAALDRSIPAVRFRLSVLKHSGAMEGVTRGSRTRPKPAGTTAPRRAQPVPAKPPKARKEGQRQPEPKAPLTHTAPPFRPDKSRSARELHEILDHLGCPAPFTPQSDWRAMNDHLAGVPLGVIAARGEVTLSEITARLKALIAPVKGPWGPTLDGQRLLIAVLRERAMRPVEAAA
jgi:hypothetical protein